MKKLISDAVNAYYGYNIEAYQQYLTQISELIEQSACPETKKQLRGEYLLIRSLAYLNTPKILCAYYEEVISIGIKTNIFDISKTFLLEWAYDDLIEYFGMPLNKADTVADELERAVKLHSYFSNSAQGTDLLYRAELAMRKHENEKALYFASEAKKILPRANTLAIDCAERITKHAKKQLIGTV